MKLLGIEEVKPQTKKHIRRKLEAEFGSSLLIFNDENNTLLVVPDNLPFKKTAVKYIETKKKLLL